MVFPLSNFVTFIYNYNFDFCSVFMFNSRMSDLEGLNRKIGLKKVKLQSTSTYYVIATAHRAIVVHFGKLFSTPETNLVLA